MNNSQTSEASLDAAFAENRALRALARPSRDDVIDAIGSLELRAANLRDMAGAGPAWLPVSEEKLARAKHYDDVAARFRALLVRLGGKAMSEENHCRDCCCARSWDALGVSSYTGKSIPEHIGELRALLHEFIAMRGRAGFRLDDWERRVKGALFEGDKTP